MLHQESKSVHSLFLFFCSHQATCGVLVPQPGIEPVPPEVEVWNPNHWTRKVPKSVDSGRKEYVHNVAIQGNHVTWTFKAHASKKKRSILYFKKKKTKQFSSCHLLTLRKHCRMDLNRNACGSYCSCLTKHFLSPPDIKARPPG